MKNILIAHNYTEDSFSAMSFHLAHHLANLGNKVVFISHKPFFNEVKSINKGKGEIIIYSWPSKKRPTSIKDALWFSKIYFKYKPDVVIGHFVGANITVTISKLLSFGKVKTIVYYHTLLKQIVVDHNTLTLRYKMLFYRKMIFYKIFCDIIVCPSDLAKADLSNFYCSKKGIVVLNPLMDRYKSKKRENNNRIVISYLGRLDSSKGIFELVQAFKKYKKQVKFSNIILNIAGTGSHEKAIKKAIIGDSTIFYFGGLSYDKIDDYLSKSHFVIIPSKADALNMVGVESMMNQTPVLISNGVGLANYLQDGVECFKFDSDIEAMISLFERVENNFTVQNQMGINARNTFLQKFNMENYCTTFSNIIV